MVIANMPSQKTNSINMIDFEKKIIIKNLEIKI